MTYENVSLGKKVGSKFIVAAPLINEEGPLFDTLDTYMNLYPGGLMLGVVGTWPYLQDENGATDPEKIMRFTERVKNDYDQSLFLAIDGEGGELFNLLGNHVPLKSARYYGKRSEEGEGTGEFERDLKRYTNVMKECGLNMNFSPVLDTAQEGYEGYMSESGRAYSDRDDTVKALGKAAIKMMQGKNIIPVGKHFPGYGPLDENPHMSLTPAIKVNRGQDIKDSPFGYAIKDLGIWGIMTGHVQSNLDYYRPATLSPGVKKFLRDSLGFKGLIIADEVFMLSLTHFYRDIGGDTEGTKRAVGAAISNDMLIVSYPKQKRDDKFRIVSDKHEHFEKMHAAVCRAVGDGTIPEGDLNESYARVRGYKSMLE